jgi:hypothetical protein
MYVHRLIFIVHMRLSYTIQNLSQKVTVLHAVLRRDITLTIRLQATDTATKYIKISFSNHLYSYNFPTSFLVFSMPNCGFQVNSCYITFQC